MQKRLLTFALAAIMTFACISPALAAEYHYDSDAPGQTFYQSTSVDSDYIENSDTIVVGADGAIVVQTDEMANSSPLSVLDIPVGDYPDSWGVATDVAIAQNSVFPNYLAPTTQFSRLVSYLIPDFYNITNGSLPTLAQSLWYPYVYYVLGEHMPAITTGGAIARLKIDSIGLDEWVYEGTTQANMNRGVAHFSCTPGWGGNVALAGHNRPSDKAFAHLKDVKVGDIVTYTTAYGTLNYVISDISTCKTTDTSGLLQDGTNKLTMYTCKANQDAVKLCVTATLVG